MPSPSTKEPFCLPINVAKLQTERLRLVPFEDDYDSNVREMLRATAGHPEVFDYLPYGPFKEAKDYDVVWTKAMSGRGIQLFAILLSAGTVRKQRPGSNEYEEHQVVDGTLAGVMSLLNTNLDNSVTEIGHILILPRYQRTFVNSTAVSLLLSHSLEPQPQGLGLRRVEWRCNSLNEPSKAAARKFGFQQEGLLRWFVALPIGKIGNSAPEMPTMNARGEAIGLGRHTCLFAICWDDWLQGGRHHIAKMLAR